MKQHCPACANLICPPSGSSEDILIVGEFPSEQEMLQGRPFATHRDFITAGKIFRKELERETLAFSDFRVTNLWLHLPNSDENCWQAGYDAVLREAKGKKAVLLVGSDVVETFTTYKVSDVSGMRVESAVLSAPLIVAMINPALAQHRAMGEVRFAVQRWKYWLEKEGLV